MQTKKPYKKPSKPCVHRRRYLRSIGQWPTEEMKKRREKHKEHNRMQARLAMQLRAEQLKLLEAQAKEMIRGSENE